MHRPTLLLALPALLLVAPAFAPAQDGGEAKKLFDAMEERLSKAKSVSLMFHLDLKHGDRKPDHLKGLLTLAEGNRAHVEAEGRFDAEDLKVTLVSDGKHLRLRKTEGGKTRPDRDRPTPKNLGAALTRVLSRAGVLFGLNSLPLGQKDKEIKADEFSVSDLKLGGKEKVGEREAQVLRYTLGRVERADKLAVTVWIDTQTHLPLKRVITDPKEGAAKGRLVETYTDFKVGAKVDAKKFELPK
jgi:outer membrane lipoprotein-sorting protein